jgi:hypothetical protein
MAMVPRSSTDSLKFFKGESLTVLIANSFHRRFNDWCYPADNTYKELD